MCIEKENPCLSVRRQCKRLSLTRSGLYDRPEGERAENLKFMVIIDKQFLDTPWYGSRLPFVVCKQTPAGQWIARHMQRQGYKCGRHLVRRLMRQGFLYLVAIMDWATRKVLAWRLSNTLDAECCIEALKEALKKYGTPEIFNTDQGSQFTRYEFTQVLKDAGIKISMDGKGRWIDNRMIERLWPLSWFAGKPLPCSGIVEIRMRLPQGLRNRLRGQG